MAAEARPRRDAIGLHWTEVETPAPFVDLAKARANIATMARKASAMPVDVRPHFKAHKCTDLARLQVDAGASGITVATTAEALALFDAEIDDVVVANEIVQPLQIEELARAASRGRLAVLVDDPANLRALALAAVAADSEIGVLVDVDTGMGRCGVRETRAARRLAALAHEIGGVRFEGVSGYEGHTTPIPDPEERATRTQEAVDRMAGFAEAIRADGLEVKAVAGGGSATYETTGADPRVTEVHPGGYALMDMARRPVVGEFEIALSVSATVISRHDRRGILDCGHKAISSLHAGPAPAGDWGEIAFAHEEHLGFDAHDSSPRPGEKVRVYPGYGPMTINLYDRLYVLAGEIVVDEWAVASRR